MNQQTLLSRLACLRICALALILACLVLEVPPAPAAGAAVTVSVTSAQTPPPAAAAPLFALDAVLGNQTRMIQVGLVVIAIGIFWLSRSIR